jgi:hypothetical protein
VLSGVILYRPVQGFVLSGPSGVVLCYLVLSTSCRLNRVLIEAKPNVIKPSIKPFLEGLKTNTPSPILV